MGSLSELFTSITDNVRKGLKRIVTSSKQLDEFSIRLKNIASHLDIDTIWKKIADFLKLDEKEQKLLKDRIIKSIARNTYAELPKLYHPNLPYILRTQELKKIYCFFNQENNITMEDIVTFFNDYPYYITADYVRSLKYRVSLPDIDDASQYNVVIIQVEGEGAHYKFHSENLQQFLLSKYRLWKHWMVSVIKPEELDKLSEEDLDYNMFLRFAKVFLVIDIEKIQ